MPICKTRIYISGFTTCFIIRAAEWVAVPAPTARDPYFHDQDKLVVEIPEATYWKKVFLFLQNPVFIRA